MRLNIPFMRYRKVWLAIAAFFVLGSLGLVAARGFNLGIDFTGGNLL